MRFEVFDICISRALMTLTTVEGRVEIPRRAPLQCPTQLRLTMNIVLDAATSLCIAEVQTSPRIASTCLLEFCLKGRERSDS